MRKHEIERSLHDGTKRRRSSQLWGRYPELKYKLEKEETHAGSENRRRADLYTTRHAPLMAIYQQRCAQHQQMRGVVHNIPLPVSKTRVVCFCLNRGIHT